MAYQEGLNRKADMLRFLRLVSKLKRSNGFFLRLGKSFPKDRYENVNS